MGSFLINFGFDPVDFSEVEGTEQYALTDDSDWRE